MPLTTLPFLFLPGEENNAADVDCAILVGDNRGNSRWNYRRDFPLIFSEFFGNCIARQSESDQFPPLF